MIPTIIHYVWLGSKAIPQNLLDYMDTWKNMMPNWQIMGWIESTIPPEVLSIPYVHQALEAKKYAFASDYIRLWALERYGGVYLDTDVEVIRSFDELQEFTMHNAQCTSFIGFEESLAQLPGTCVMGCEAHCLWIREMLATYDGVEFVKKQETRNKKQEFDLTTNVIRLGTAMVEKYGLVRNGKEQFLQHLSLPDLSISEGDRRYEIIHVYDHHYFSPITSTRVMRKNKNTYTIHHFAGSWTGDGKEHWYDHPACREMINAMIQLKRWFKKIGKTSLLDYTEKYEIDD